MNEEDRRRLAEFEPYGVADRLFDRNWAQQMGDAGYLAYQDSCMDGSRGYRITEAGRAHLAPSPSPSPSPCEELQRLALILATDADARAQMIEAIGVCRSASMASELADVMARIAASEKSDP